MRPLPDRDNWKAGIILEECGLTYTLREVDILAGALFEPGIPKIIPNNKMRAIVDQAGRNQRILCAERLV